MKKTLLLAAALLVVTATMASAQRGSLTLGWNSCRVSGLGLSNINFACNSNSGTNLLVGGMVVGPTANLTSVNAADLFLDIFTQSPSVVAWWQLSDPTLGTPGCRGLAANYTPDFTNAAAVACDRTYWPDVSTPSGGASYQWPTYQPNHARLRMIVAVDNTAAPTVAQATVGQEMNLFNAQVKRNQTAGASPPACAGCLTPACITFTLSTIFQSSNDNFPIGDPETFPRPLVAPDRVAWNTPQAPCPTDPTPTQSKTWGGIKSIYR